MNDANSAKQNICPSHPDVCVTTDDAMNTRVFHVPTFEEF